MKLFLKCLLLILYQSIVCVVCSATTIDLSKEEAIAVTSFENSNAITRKLPPTDMLSAHRIASSRAKFICESRGYDFATSYSPLREVYEAKEFLVYNDRDPEKELLRLFTLIQFKHEETGEIILHADKFALSPAEAKKYIRVRIKDQPTIPHLLFNTMECGNIALPGI